MGQWNSLEAAWCRAKDFHMRHSMIHARGLLAGLIGFAFAALSLSPARGSAPHGLRPCSDGDPVILGQESTADNTTRIVAHEIALWGISNTDDGALVGESVSLDGYGVRGTSPYIGVNAIGGEVGVYAVSDYGAGVQALTYDGVAVSASTAVDAGTALRVDGRAEFSRSGKVTVAAGMSSATVTGVPLTSESLVLATLQERIHVVHVEAAVPDVENHSFTLYLNRKVPRPTTVAWFVVN